MAKHSKSEKRSAGSNREISPSASGDGARKPGVGDARLFWAQVALIAGAALWIFWPALHGSWLWDDNVYITNNPLLRDTAGWWKIWFQQGSFVEYYPVEQTVLWIEWQLWGSDTLGYHLTNVLLHILSALLVWRLLGKLGLSWAWLGGLLFVLHPMQVESVAWMTELKNTLSLPPFLLAMYAWIDYDQTRRRKYYLLALGLFLVAMLCKVTMAMFPVVILLYAWWKRGRLEWRDLIVTIPFLAVSLELGFNTILLGKMHLLQAHSLPPPVALGGVSSRLACAGLALAFYFSKFFWPLGLLPIYPQWVVNPPSPIQFWPWALLAIAAFWLWHRRNGWGRHALLGLGFFVFFLVPFLGFISVSYMSFTWVMDHFLYIPIIGLIGLTVAALERIQADFFPAARVGLRIFIAVVFSLLAWESRAYAGIFINQEALWNYTLKYNPTAELAYNDLGVVLAGKGLLPEAIADFDRALKIKPDYAEAHNNLGIALIRSGRVPEAVDEFDAAVKLAPNALVARHNLGRALTMERRSPEAWAQFQAAIKLKPADAEAFVGMGDILLQDGRFPQAIEAYRQVLQINPGYVEAYDNLGIALAQTNQISEAITQFETALQLNPNDDVARSNLIRLKGVPNGASAPK